MADQKVPEPETFETALAAARSRDPEPGPFVAVIEGYCTATACTVRTVVLRVKEFGDERTPPGLRCPACRRPLKLHWVRTLVESERVDEEDARCSVNTQRYIRDHKTPDDPWSATVPVNVFVDDSLPEEDLP